MSQKGLEDCRPGALAACGGGGGHPAYPPGTRSTIGGDESDRDKRATVEDADGIRVGGLVRGETLPCFARAQHLMAQRPGVGERDLADDQA
jgi:hypothetical protein